jgi:type I restriction enzyme S subunit
MAPLAEQQRIADKLDTLLSRIDACRDRLDRVGPLLQRFRQSVLSSATSGELDSSQDEWPVVRLGDVAGDFSYGSATKSSPTGQVPVLRMGNLQRGKLDWNDLVFTSNADEVDRYRLERGDVLFNRTNSPELVGKTAVYKGERPAIYAGYLIRIRCSRVLHPEFLHYCLSAPAGRDYCRRVKSDGVSQSNINATKLRDFTLSLPPIDVQKRIVDRVETLLSLSDHIEARCIGAVRGAKRLTQATLAKAFRGELVPQDPNDEPASALLARLRQPAAAADPARRRRRAPVP